MTTAKHGLKRYIMIHSVKMIQMSPNALLCNGQFNVENGFFFLLFFFFFLKIYLHGKLSEHSFLGNKAINTTLLIIL